MSTAQAQEENLTPDEVLEKCKNILVGFENLSANTEATLTRHLERRGELAFVFKVINDWHELSSCPTAQDTSQDGVPVEPA